MEHDKAKELFTSYHDGDLSADVSAQLEQHLEGCESCAVEWESFKRTVSEISGLLAFAPPADLTRSVETKIRKRSRGKFFGKQKNDSLQFALVSFILILLFILAYLMLTAVTEITILEEAGNTDVSSPSGEIEKLQPIDNIDTAGN